MNFAFASVVSKTSIKKGAILSRKNICLKRPGNGDFKAKDFTRILGKKIKKNIKENVQIKKIYIK